MGNNLWSSFVWLAVAWGMHSHPCQGCTEIPVAILGWPSMDDHPSTVMDTPICSGLIVAGKNNVKLKRALALAKFPMSVEMEANLYGCAQGIHGGLLRKMWKLKVCLWIQACITQNKYLVDFYFQYTFGPTATGSTIHGRPSMEGHPQVAIRAPMAKKSIRPSPSQHGHPWIAIPAWPSMDGHGTYHMNRYPGSAIHGVGSNDASRADGHVSMCQTWITIRKTIHGWHIDT